MELCLFFFITFWLMGFMDLYVYVRVIHVTSLPRWVCGILGLCIALALWRVPITRWLYGTPNALLPYPLLIGAGFVQCLALSLFLVTLGRDLAALIARLCRWRWGPIRPLRVLAVALPLAVWGFYGAVGVPAVRHVQLAVPDLPPALHGFTIAQLSDLHIGPLFNRAWLEGVVDKVNAQKPDLIAITGDVVDGPVAALRNEVAPLAQLKAPYGNFLSIGNHELYSGLEDWAAEFTRMGLLLRNAHTTLNIKGTPFVVAAVSDGGDLDLEMTLANAPKASILLLAHRPDLASRSAAAGVNIQLSGHTHGGLWLPLQSLIAKFNSGFVQGIYNVEGMRLYVHAGSGLWAGFPFRLGVPSEIAILTLVPART